jgi:hypothetical protein
VAIEKTVGMDATKQLETCFSVEKFHVQKAKLKFMKTLENVDESLGKIDSKVVGCKLLCSNVDVLD